MSATTCTARKAQDIWEWCSVQRFPSISNWINHQISLTAIPISFVVRRLRKKCTNFQLAFEAPTTWGMFRVCVVISIVVYPKYRAVRALSSWNHSLVGPPRSSGSTHELVETTTPQHPGNGASVNLAAAPCRLPPELYSKITSKSNEFGRPLSLKSSGTSVKILPT